VRARNAARYEAGLTAALDRLRAVGPNNWDSVWQATFEVLAWLYLCEEAEERQDAEAYRADRRATEKGRTLAGLIWLRGLVVHEQADFDDVAPVPVTWGGERVTWGGEPVTWGVGFAWRARRDLPWRDPAKDERVEMYGVHVERDGLLPPLERAHRYLLSR
jgi:hypothetical protein